MNTPHFVEINMILIKFKRIVLTANKILVNKLEVVQMKVVPMATSPNNMPLLKIYRKKNKIQDTNFIKPEINISLK